MQIYITGTIIATIFAMLSQYFLVRSSSMNGEYRNLKSYNISFGNVLGNFLKYLSMLPLVLIAALREDIGTDYTHIYVQNFYKVLSGIYEHMGISYQMINILVAKWTNNYHWVFLVTVLIFLSVTYRGIYKLSTSYGISVLLLVITFNYLHFLNTERQFIAISITLYALTWLMKDNKKIFVLFTLLAASFHYSALIFLIVLFFDRFKLDGKGIYILLVGLAITRPLIGAVIAKIVSYTPYVYYFTSKYNSAEWTKTQPMYLAMNLLVITTFIIGNRKKTIDRKRSILIAVQFIATAFSILMGEVPLLDRIMIYFSFVQIVSIPYMLDLRENKLVNTILLATVICMYMGYFYFGLQFNWSGVNPYKTFVNFNEIW